MTPELFKLFLNLEHYRYQYAKITDYSDFQKCAKYFSENRNKKYSYDDFDELCKSFNYDYDSVYSYIKTEGNKLRDKLLIGVDFSLPEDEIVDTEGPVEKIFSEDSKLLKFDLNESVFQTLKFFKYPELPETWEDYMRELNYTNKYISTSNGFRNVVLGYSPNLIKLQEFFNNDYNIWSKIKNNQLIKKILELDNDFIKYILENKDRKISCNPASHSDAILFDVSDTNVTREIIDNIVKDFKKSYGINIHGEYFISKTSIAYNYSSHTFQNIKYRQDLLTGRYFMVEIKGKA